MTDADGLDRAARAIADARRVVVSTGAGMSAESGIPTFREARTGVWARFDPTELASEPGFRADSERVWAWYAERRARMRAARPHAGHEAVVQLAGLVPDLAVVTQNIDGLHQRAGSTDVIELHGSIDRYRCLDAGHEYGAGEPPFALGGGGPPACPVCGSPLRPAVVWFGEQLPADAVARAWRLADACDVMLVVGTSGIVWPAAELPLVAGRAGASVVEVNPEPAAQGSAIRLADAAGVALPALVAAVQRLRHTG